MIWVTYRLNDYTKKREGFQIHESQTEAWRYVIRNKDEYGLEYHVAAYEPATD